ncbi:MAG TPA: Fic family protein [Labilithrix sp.]|nr:Fic family protein [Labilithrix sp.]
MKAKSLEVIRESAALGAMLHPVTRQALVELLHKMNSYYSNLIEGHNTHPTAIERALIRDYAAEPAKRALQEESVAHIQVQRRMEERLAAEPSLEICEPEFLCWLHREFYSRLPEEFHSVEQHDGARVLIVPGTLRTSGVRVGRHFAPLSDSLPSFLERFAKAYSPARFDDVDRILAAAASHHRLLWIHPFLDGNGRVTRLFTHAYLHRARIDGHGLWAATRGLARRREEYVAALADADEPRRGDLDGRGNLSERGLTDFCEFFLDTALDQIRFMREVLDLDGVQERVLRFAELAAGRGEVRIEAGFLLRDVVLRGEIARGEAARITGLGTRSAQALVAELVRKRLLVSETPKGPLRLGLPPSAVAYYFPRLYPEGIEAGMRTSTH